MRNFKNIQILSSVIPFFSTIFVLIVTMVELKRNRADAKQWFRFALIFFLSGIVVSLLYLFIAPTMHSVLIVLISVCILALTNIGFVRLQISSAGEKKEVNKSDKNFVYIFTGLVLFALLLLAASAGIMSLISVVDIEDVNGAEESSLAVISLEDLLSTENNYTALKSGQSFSGEKTMVAGMLEDCDYDKVVYHCKKISGIQTLQATKTEEDTLALKLESELKSGNAEIVILVDGEYYSHMDLNSVCSVTVPGAADKEIVVRLAAESAEISLCLEREAAG